MAEPAVSTSMSDSIRAAMKEVSAAQPEEPVQEPAEQPEPVQETEQSAAERARDKAGRFASAETPADKQQRETLTLKPKETKDAAPKPERPQEQSKTPTEQAAARPAAQAAPAQVGPPPHWNGAAKIDWNKIPGALRESIAKDYEAVGKAQGLVSVLQPYEQRLARDFGGTDRGIAAIMGTWDYAQTQPLAFMRDFCNKYGIDPQSLGSGQPVQGQQAQEQQDPYAVRFQQIETALQQIAQQPVIHQQNQIHSDIQNFQTATQPDGSVAHPYFNDVRQHMGALMQTPYLVELASKQGGQAALKEAYDQACWANPTVRGAILKEQEASKEAERRQAIERAQGAAVSVSGSPGVNGHPQRQAQSVSDELRSVMRAAKGGRA